MTAEEYFGDWVRVIDSYELNRIMRWLATLNKEILCPEPKNIFKAFKVCSLKNCKAVMLGQDPYPQKGVATGILFGNSASTPENELSPSLQVVKESMINYEIPHNYIEFDNTFESLARQGVLMINTALTCEVNKVGSHFEIWKPFISKFLHNLSSYDPSLVYLLFGNQASMFKNDITKASNIIEVYHPAYYARRQEKMPSNCFEVFNNTLRSIYGSGVEYYKETDYGNC